MHSDCPHIISCLHLGKVQMKIQKSLFQIFWEIACIMMTFALILFIFNVCNKNSQLLSKLNKIKGIFFDKFKLFSRRFCGCIFRMGLECLKSIAYEKTILRSHIVLDLKFFNYFQTKKNPNWTKS